MTNQMREFLSDWLHWAESGAPAHPAFTRHNGLCDAAYKTHGYAFDTVLKRLFCEDGLDPVYPFGERDFWIDHEDATQHLNADRLAWVRSKLEEV